MRTHFFVGYYTGIEISIHCFYWFKQILKILFYYRHSKYMYVCTAESQPLDKDFLFLFMNAIFDNFILGLNGFFK
jgi:hypothetical protein